MAKYKFPQHVDVHEFVTIKLSGSNFFTWKSKMLILIQSHGLVDFVSDTVTDSQIQEEKDWKKIDGLIKRWILATVSDDFFLVLAKMKSARAIWEFLFEKFGENVLHGEVDAPNGIDLNSYLPLAKAALNNDWEKAAKFLEEEPEAIRSIITCSAETLLMIAVRSILRMDFTRKLVAIMSPEDLALADESGCTALHVAAQIGNIEAAKLLVAKNPSLPYNFDNRLKLLPVHHAADAGKKQMCRYLMSVTKENADLNPYYGESGSRLIALLISNGFYDVALSLVESYPSSAIFDGLPLGMIALNCYEFKSAAARLNFWQSLIYSCVSVKRENEEVEDRKNASSAGFVSVVVRQKLYRLFWKVAERSVPQVKVIQDKKVFHYQAQQLLKQIVGKIIKLEYSKANALLIDPLMIASNLGVHEIVEYIIEMHPTAIHTKNTLGHSFLHAAILNRHEKVYNIIYQIDEVRHLFLSQCDQTWNRPLHAAGCLEDTQKSKLRASATGAALQLQRELQWFKEVEKLTTPQMRLYCNRNGKTASLLFTETHEELVKEAEKWVKDTSNSFTIVAALILTVVFAAAITVPGGNDGNTGLPFHAGKKSFTVFAVSDALALFSSTCSLLMFLSILTSQYSEADFLYALPKRLIIGLATLFLAIIFMMVAFSATVQILFGNLKSGVLVPLISLAFVPITLFMTLQFSLLVDIIKSTYGPGIFGKQSDRILH